MTINESSPATFLAESIMRSAYFNDAPCTFPPFTDEQPPTMRTMRDLDAYANAFNHAPDLDDRPLRDRLIDALDNDLRDLAHNANYDDFLDDARELCDDDFADIDRILNDPDTDLYDLIADALIARASD